MRKKTFLFCFSLIGLIALSWFLRNGGFRSTTKFTPEELADMENNFDADILAGKFIDKGFVGFKEDWKGKKYEYTLYSYYYGTWIDKDAEFRSRNEDKKERITVLDELKCIRYDLRDKKAYYNFVSYLDKIKTDSIEEMRKIYANRKHYIFNKSVFVERGYIQSKDVYIIEIYPIDKFVNPKADTLLQNYLE